jgi:hypothetical protein
MLKTKFLFLPASLEELPTRIKEVVVTINEDMIDGI